MRLLIANAFSLSMLDRDAQRGAPTGYTPRAGEESSGARVPRPVDDPAALVRDFASNGVQVISIVGHIDTAAVFGILLGRPIECARETIQLGRHDHVLVGQYIGPRLPAHATALPEGARIEWWVI